MIDEPVWGVLFLLDDLFVSKEAVDKYMVAYEAKVREKEEEEEEDNEENSEDDDSEDEDDTEEDSDSDSDSDSEEEEDTPVKIINSDQQILQIQQDLQQSTIKQFVLHKINKKYPMGLMMFSFRNIFRNLLRKGSFRIVEPMYRCVLQVLTLLSLVDQLV